MVKKQSKKRKNKDTVIREDSFWYYESTSIINTKQIFLRKENNIEHQRILYKESYI